MLSLVAYQSSEESESDSETFSNIETPETKSSENDSSQMKNSNSSLCSAVVPSKTKEAVKIMIPSLKEFEDDEKNEPSSKKIKKSTGSGLIGLLPPPKYSKSAAASQKSFVPYILTKKHSPSGSHVASSVDNSSSKELSRKPTSFTRPLVKTECHSEMEPAVVEKEDSSPITDFFSLEEPIHHRPKFNFPVPLSNTLKKSTVESSQMTGDIAQTNNQFEASSISPENKSTSWQDECGSDHVQYSESTSATENCAVESSLEGQPVSSSYDGYPEIDSSTAKYPVDEGFLKLQGKKRKGQEEINIIDVSVDDQLSDKTEWLTKSITQEQVHRPSRKKDDMPTQLQKRKHQITYLAFQAKERELELKNQWSQNRLTKRETQAKYGF